jgi:hypothetical protein
MKIWFGKMLKKIIIWVLVFGITILSGCAQSAETGILQGRVTIGPLTPVERPGVTPTVPPEVYQARKILVFDKDGKNLIKTVDIDNNGNYRVELKTGNYVIDINHLGIDRSSDVPKPIQVNPGGTVNLNIDIDTGIR